MHGFGRRSLMFVLGAVPPWLRGDDNDDDDETSIIGSPEELFLNHGRKQ